ncbi:MAG: hypothetical protein H6824_17865 [Planctomycetaceae bacterium]|nr:hypothetical protein [Planctomycetaceae bacterium]
MDAKGIRFIARRLRMFVAEQAELGRHQFDSAGKLLYSAFDEYGAFSDVEFVELRIWLRETVPGSTTLEHVNVFMERYGSTMPKYSHLKWSDVPPVDSGIWQPQFGLEALPSIAEMLEIMAGGSDDEANMQKKLFPKGVPRNPDIVDLVVRIHSESDDGRSFNQIAEELTEGDVKRARSLLASIRRLRKEGRVQL